MLVMACVALVVAAVPLTRGRLSGLAEIDWRRPWLLLVALLTQVLLLEVSVVPGRVAAVVHVLSYLVVGAFVVVNRHVVGLPLVAVGAGLNGLVIALNGGTLPASPEALRRSGIELDEGFVNSGVVDDPVLGWLGDAFAVPSWVPLANVFSIGDVLIVAGAAWVVWAATRRRGAAASPEGSAEHLAHRA